jgi:hypothetical protein
VATKKVATKKPSQTKQRRPASKRSPLSAATKKSTIAKAARQSPSVKKKPITKPRKTVAKKKTTPINAPKKTTKKITGKTTTRPSTIKKRKTVAKTRTVQLVSLPLSRKTRLTLTLNRTKPAPKKQASKAKVVKKQQTKSGELILSLSLVLIGLAGSAYFGLRAFASPTAPTVNVVTKKSILPPVVKRFLPRSVPTHINIPDVQISAPLLGVDKEDNGSIHVPLEDNTAGWYRQSPTPGEAGPAIIVGHLDTIFGLGVFWRLHELSPSQIIEIDREDNTRAQFVIEKIQQYPQSSFPADEVYGNTTSADLRLISCGGTFNRLTGHYSDNIVVYASLVPQAIVTQVYNKPQF